MYPDVGLCLLTVLPLRYCTKCK